jgi:hypothetical protein
LPERYRTVVALAAETRRIAKPKRSGNALRFECAEANAPLDAATHAR